MRPAAIGVTGLVAALMAALPALAFRAAEWASAVESPTPSATDSALPAECDPSRRLPEEEVLASGALGYTSDELVFEEPAWSAAVSRTTEVLRLVRAEMRVARLPGPRFNDPWRLTLNLQGSVADDLRARGGDGTATVQQTGDPEIDALLAQISARAVRLVWGPGYTYAYVCLDARVNVHAAIARFSSMASVAGARAGGPPLPGDFPALTVGERNEVWYVVVREASGDCPAGCTYEALSIFRIDGQSLSWMTREQAEADPLIVEMVRDVRGRDTPWPLVKGPSGGSESATLAVTAGSLPPTGREPGGTPNVWPAMAGLFAVAFASWWMGVRKPD